MGDAVACQICETNENLKKVSLYAHEPNHVLVCSKHSWELFLMGERRFISKYQSSLGSQYKVSSKKPGSGKSTLVS
jgi:hypothetical protein